MAGKGDEEAGKEANPEMCVVTAEIPTAAACDTSEDEDLEVLSELSAGEVADCRSSDRSRSSDMY